MATTIDKRVVIEFPRTGNAWLDAGIVGLYRLIMGKPSYLVPAPNCDYALPGSKGFETVTAALDDHEFSLSGDRDKVERCLHTAYDRLIKCYFSISSSKQKEDKGSWNFYYSTGKDSFVPFPKKKPAGAALLLFDKAARKTGSQVAWGKENNKKIPGRLPADYEFLQERLNDFLREQGLKAGPPAGMLIDGENQVRPNTLKIKLAGNLPDTPCFLSGVPKLGLGDAKQTAFPLLGGSRSFTNEVDGRLKIGWQADFAGKFTPAICFFMQQKDDLHVFFPCSSSLHRVDRLADSLAAIVEPHANLYRNFEDHLGHYFARRSETTLAFLHRVCSKLTQQRHTDSPQRIVETEPLGEDDVASEPQDQVLATDVYNETMRNGTVTFMVVSVAKKGNVWMPRVYRNFTDVVYIARLFECMQASKHLPDGRVRHACSPKAFFNSLVDFTERPPSTLVRDQVCDAILEKRSVLGIIERHAFHINRSSDPSNSRRTERVSWVWGKL